MMGLPEGWEGSYERLLGSLNRKGSVRVPREVQKPPKIKVRSVSLPIMDFDDDELVRVAIYLPVSVVEAMDGEDYKQAITDYLLKRGKTWWVSRWFTALNLK